MSTQNAIVGAHTNAVDAIRAAQVTLSDEARAKYSGAGGAGDDSFEYRRGSGASALCFVFAVNAAYNGNAPMSRAACALDQMAYVESKLWPGKTRGAIEPALASMFGRGYLSHTNGSYTLSEKGMARARLMFADLGLTWPEEQPTEKPAPKAKKARKAKTPKAAPGYDVAETSVPANEPSMNGDASPEFSLADMPDEAATNENANDTI